MTAPVMTSWDSLMEKVAIRANLPTPYVTRICSWLTTLIAVHTVLYGATSIKKFGKFAIGRKAKSTGTTWHGHQKGTAGHYVQGRFVPSATLLTKINGPAPP